jgi:phosphoglycolate phosphatase
MIRVVVFDFDGTLVDSNAIKREGFFRLAARYPEGVATMASVMGTAGDRRSILSAFAARMAAEGVRLNAAELVASYGAGVDAAVAAAPEIRGASNLLASLRQTGLTLHLSSATPTASLLAILKARGWTALFSGIHGAPNSKIETLRKICEVESAKGEQIVVLGDGIDDARAAELVGAQFIAVGSGSYAATNPDVPMLSLPAVGAHLLALKALASDA